MYNTTERLVLLHGGCRHLCDLALVLVVSLALLALDEVLAILVEVELGDDEVRGVNGDLNGGAYEREKACQQRSKYHNKEALAPVLVFLDNNNSKYAPFALSFVRRSM